MVVVGHRDQHSSTLRRKSVQPCATRFDRLTVLAQQNPWLLDDISHLDLQHSGIRLNLEFDPSLKATRSARGRITVSVSLSSCDY